MATTSSGCLTLSGILIRYRTIGVSGPVDLLASGSSAFQAWRRGSTRSPRGLALPSGDSASPSPTAFRTMLLNALDRWGGGRRDEHRGATGGAWPDPDSATRCHHGARWGISYIPYTCVTCRLHVRLHAMEIETSRFVACMNRFRAGRHPHDGLSRHHGADARGWLTVTHLRGRVKALKPFDWMNRRAGRIMGARSEMSRRDVHRSREAWLPGKTGPSIGEAVEPCGVDARNPSRHGRVSPWRTPVRRGESYRSWARRRGFCDAAKTGESAYPVH